MIPLRDANPTRRFPIVTLGLIAACFAAFAYELTLQAGAGSSGLDSFISEYGVVPNRVTSALDRRDLFSGATFGLLSSQFLHAGWLHILGNMLYLWIFGNNVEDRMGRLPFLVFYLVGGVIAGLTQVFISPDSSVPLIGASGAIAAALGAYLVLYPRARVLSLVFLAFFYQLIEVPAIIVLGFWFVLQFLDGVMALGTVGQSAGGVAVFAHIGGFVAGMLVAVPYRLAGRGR